MFQEKNKGKIIIQVEKENQKINSTLKCNGIAKTPEVALTTLLINFVSLSIEKGKDPKKLISNHLDEIISMVEQAKKI